jgi:hypothetical protein
MDDGGEKPHLDDRKPFAVTAQDLIKKTSSWFMDVPSYAGW